MSARRNWWRWEISLLIGIKPTSVCRLFRRFQGTSPYQYLLRRKMIQAAEYLVETGGLVKEAAQRVGLPILSLLAMF